MTSDQWSLVQARASAEVIDDYAGAGVELERIPHAIFIVLIFEMKADSLS